MCIKKYGHHFLGETLLCFPEYGNLHDPLTDEKRCWNSRTSAINNKLFMLGVFADGGSNLLQGYWECMYTGSRCYWQDGDTMCFGISW